MTIFSIDIYFKIISQIFSKRIDKIPIIIKKYHFFFKWRKNKVHLFILIKSKYLYFLLLW